MPKDADGHSGSLKVAQAQMYEGRFDAALATLAPVLEADPDLTDALYMSAVCARYLDRRDAARDYLDRIKRQAPEFGRAHQEEGHLLRAAGEAERALSAYQRACQFNPALQASWRAQAEILAELGRHDEAAQAAAQAERIAALPQELTAVTHLLHEGKLVKAEQLCRAFLQKTPHHVEAMRLLAEIGSRFGVLEDADFLLESAIEFEPDNIQLRLDYIQILRKRQKFEAALAQARYLYDRDPLNPLFQSHYAIECMQTGNYDRALDLFETILQKLPNDAATLTSRGHALKTLGRHDEAVASYRQAFAAQPGHGDAYYALANLKTYQFTDDEMAAMQAQEAGADLSFQNRIHLCFALGKAFEDRGEYDRSFEYYARGNDLKRVQTRYTAEQMEQELAAQAEVCTADLFENRAGGGCMAPDPIFIVGLPRAGSTLLEQILASHSQVDGTLELPNILALAHRLRGRKRLTDKTRYPRILHELSADQLRELGEDYIENTRIHRQGAPFFTDKMPNNFRHIGLIKLILPNAKIIDARREPMAWLLLGLQATLRRGAGVYLRARGDRPLLPWLCRADGALGPRVAGADSARPLRGRGGRP